ncbi:MAG: GTP cyclohydrolase IIa [Candidatus Nezhaarchaeales archaeon]
MVKVGLLRLMNYETWISSLGYDREHFIQINQHRILEEVYKQGASIGAFPVPLTYDLIALILNSIESSDYLGIIEALTSISPVPIRALIGQGATYTEALINVSEVKSQFDDVIEEPTVAVHVDLNDYYEVLKREGPYHAYRVIMKLAEELRRLALKVGGLATYIGGDNVLAFIPINSTDNFVKEVLDKADVKVGVGIAPIPRKAVALSTEALATIRKEGMKRRSLKLMTLT